MRVDSHHHLWHYNPQEYGWIDDSMQALRRDFLLADLEREVAATVIAATVAVQARQSLAETRWLLDLAARSSTVCAVIGWAPLTAENFSNILDVLTQNSLLKGLRHVVQAEPDGFLDRPDFNRGIDAMLPSALVYDLLIRTRQLPEATRFVDRHPKQTFVLDHIAKPDIAHDGFAAWDKSIRELAERDNVMCKLSGMVTEADWKTWTPEQLKPYFDTVLEAFGPERLMFGSDWPVLTVACDYARWVGIVDAWLAPLSEAEREQIQGMTATSTYLLTTTSNYQTTTTS